MIVRIERSELGGAIKAEPSKSMAHRLLICAGLAEGESRIYNIAESEDILATIDCLRALGAEVRIEEESKERGGNINEGGSRDDEGSGGGDINEGDSCDDEGAEGGAGASLRRCIVRGTNPSEAKSAVLPCRESGSTMRFFAPIAALSGDKMTLTGSETLLGRPMSVYEDVFKSSGVRFARASDHIETEGRLRAGEYEIDGGISSQFASGLLFALPLADGDSLLRLAPPVESSAYIDMSIDALGKFGVTVHRDDEHTIRIPGGQIYEPCDVCVEGDWSNAAFFMAMGVSVEGLDEDSLQGDKVCRELFDELDRGFREIDISGCPDLGPVLMAYAAMRGGCRLTGTRRLRIKESDRGSAMAEELGKFGVKCRIEENSIEVESGIKEPAEILSGHNDHRIVMALSMLASKTGGVMSGAEAVNKSFPAFFKRFAEAGGSFRTE